MVAFYHGREIFRKTLVIFVLLSGLGFLIGCFNSIGSGTAAYRITADGGAGLLSVSESLNLSIDENGPVTTVILPYTGSDGVVPRSCEIQSLSNVTEASPCACVSGTCRVGIRGETDVYGQGSFLFHLASASGIFSNFGRAEVKIRQVTIWPFPSFKQEQKVTVGETIKSPLVVLVWNSENAPVSGVKVSWKALEGSGGISSCTETSDSKGLARCDWTLGTKSGSQSVEATIFDERSKASFSVSAVGGTATQLSYLEPPSDTIAGVPWVRPPQVVFQDVYGNQSSSSAGVTLTIAANPSLGALSGKTTVKAVDGIASFGGLSINKAGIGYALKASSEGLAEVVSSVFRVDSGAAAKLVFTQQPGGAVVGKAFATQPVVMIQDVYGNQVTNGVDAGMVLTLSLASGTGTLSGKATVRAVDGIASFSGLSIDKVGVDYTLKASSPGLAGVVSSAFKVSSGATAKLAFTTQPSDTAAGVQWVRPPQVVFQDVYGNRSSSSANVTLTIAANPSSGALSGKTTVKAVDGVASFSGLFIDKVGSDYTLKASSPGLEVVSSAFKVNSGVAAKLVFTRQPGGAVAGKVLATQPVVMIQDAYRNQVTSGIDAGAVLTLSLAPRTGTLFGTLSVGSALGISSWMDLFIEPPGPKALIVTKPDLRAFGGSGPLTVTSDVFENKPNPPPAVTGLKARAASGAVALSWTASSTAASYNILRGTSPNSLVQIATSRTIAYTDRTVSDGVLYYYAVQAVSELGTSASSQNIQAKPLSTPFIKSFAINDTVGAVILSWSESLGASDYAVKYSTKSGSAAQGTEGCRVRDRSCTVRNLTPGTKYYFAVNAINEYSGSVDSGESYEVSRVLVLSSVEPGNRQIKLKYKSEGATSTAVRYGTRPGSYASSLPGGRDEVIVSGLVNGTTYYFQLEAKHPAEGLFSGGVLRSAEVAASPDGPQSFAIISARLGLYGSNARLTWESSLEASSYSIKYGTSSGSYSTFATGYTGTSVKVTGLTGGKTYYFMVTATNGSGSQDANREFVKTLKAPVILAKESYATPTMAMDWSMSIPVKLEGEEFSSLPCSSIKFKPNTGGLSSALNVSSIQGESPNCRLDSLLKGGVTGLLVLTFSAEMDSEVLTKNVEVRIMPEASLAYSTRRVVLGYKGKAMEVRHKNGALADVAFDENGKVSPSSPLTITRPPHKIIEYEVPVNSEYRYKKGDVVSFEDFYNFKKAGKPPEPAAVFVRRWYDQSGNDNHALAPAEDQPYAVIPSDKQPYIVKEVLVDGRLSAVLQDAVSFERRGRKYGDRVGTESCMEIKYKEGSLDLAGGYSISTVFSDGGNWRDRVAPSPISALFTQKWSGGSIPVTLGIMRVDKDAGLFFGLGIHHASRGWDLIYISAKGSMDAMVPKDDRQRMRFFGSYNGNNRNVFFHLQGGVIVGGNMTLDRPVDKSKDDFYIGRRWDNDGAPDIYFPMELNELVVYKHPLEEERRGRILADQGSYYPVP